MNKYKDKILTVVIPILNVNNNLIKTLKSIQKNPFVICILVKPDTLTFTFTLDGMSIEVINESSGGIYSAFNDGLKATYTDFVMFCGSGDLLNIDNIIKNIRCNGDVDIIEGVVHSDYRKRMNHGLRSSNPIKLDDLFSSHSVGLVFKTNFHKRVGYYDLRFAVCADYDLVIRAHDHIKKFYSTDDVFGFWPANGFSSRGSGLKKALEHYSIRKKNKSSFRYLFLMVNILQFTVFQKIKNLIKFILKVHS